MRALNRTHSDAPPAPAIRGARPVLLATLDVPFDDEAVSVAVDAAVESGQPLLVVNVAAVPVLPISLTLGYEYIEREDVEAALRAPAELARSLAVEVERLRVCSPHPVAALLEVVGEREPGLLVFGPDRGKVRRRTYRKAARAVSEHAPCLVWLAA